jgi:hypothetical protein
MAQPEPEATGEAPLASPAARAVLEAVPAPEGSGDDILGLRELFPGPGRTEPRRALSEEEVDAIADRVLERLSSEVVESIAWDIVPEIADRVMEDERKRRK